MAPVNDREKPDDAGHRSCTPAPTVAADDSDARGSTRRHFFLSVAAAAAGIGCRPPPRVAKTVDLQRPPVPAARAPETVDASIRAVRDHVLKLESPPSFVFTTQFKDVP